jgi:hypothetical protein
VPPALSRAEVRCIPESRDVLRSRPPPLPPASGFRYAFENGADFICVGMFDFQVAQDAELVRKILPETQTRHRDWVG